MTPSIHKALAAALLCATVSLSWAGQTMLFIADDLAGLPAMLESASTAALATDDTPIVLVIKDTQVALAVSGSTSEKDLRESLSGGVRMFICEKDLDDYGISPARVLSGITLVKAAPKAEENSTEQMEVKPLERFRKQVEKVCNQ